MESPQLQALRQRAVDLCAENNVIVAQADAERRPMSKGEQMDVEKNNDVVDSLFCQIEAGERAEKLAQPQARPVIDTLPARGGRGAFNSVGSFLHAVKYASAGSFDPRLVKDAITTFGGEATGPDGGFAVPPDFRNAILELVIGKNTLVDYLNPVVSPSSMVTFVTDEASAHSTSGITATWTDEGATITASKPVLKQVNVPLRKIAGLCSASDELLEDSPGMNQYILRLLAKKIRFTLEDSLVAGDGVGKPLGLLNGPATILQAKLATGSTAIAPRDLGNMVSRLVPGGFDNAFWLVHDTVLPELWALVLGTTPLLVADYSKSPVGTLLGKPVVVSESCSTYNTAGDIALVDPAGYALAVKSSGLRQDTTIAFAFDQGLQSFRATMRIGGQPLLSAAVARKNGGSTQGHVVTLATRS